MKKILSATGHMLLVIPAGVPLVLFEGNPILQALGFFTALGIIGMICLKLNWV